MSSRALNGWSAESSSFNISAGSSSNVTFTFDDDVFFADTDYTASVIVEDSTGSLRVNNIISKTRKSVTVEVENTDGSNQQSGSLHLIVIHD